mgnify:CR=1 FL=1
MFNKTEILALYDAQMRIGLRLPEAVFENTGRIVRDHSRIENAGFINYADLDEICAEEEITAQIAFFRSLNMPFTWKVYDHDQPADMRQRLAAHGFEVGSPSMLMAYQLPEAPIPLPEQSISRVQRVTEEREIEAIVCVEEAVYQSPRDWLRKRLLHMYRTTPQWISLYAGFAEEEVVAGAWIIYYPGSQFASLLGGATLPEFRSRGYYTALLVARMRAAQDRGMRFLVVDASSMSEPLLSKHGFLRLEHTSYCRWSPPGQAE